MWPLKRRDRESCCVWVQVLWRRQRHQPQQADGRKVSTGQGARRAGVAVSPLGPRQLRRRAAGRLRVALSGLGPGHATDAADRPPARLVQAAAGRVRRPAAQPTIFGRRVVGRQQSSAAFQTPADLATCRNNIRLLERYLRLK